MNGKLLIRHTLTSLIIIISIASQSGYCSQSEKIYKSYVDGKIEDWEKVIIEMENTDCSSEACSLELISYYYGYTGYLIQEKQNHLAEAYIKKAEQRLKSIIKTTPDHATAHAFMGAFLGFRMTIDKMKMPILGPKSMKYINYSLHLNPENIQGLIEKGNALNFAPEALGGSKPEAIHYYVKALKLMEQKKFNRKNWLYLKILIDLAKAYEATGHTDQALRLYERILRIEPDFKWVKDELYPKLKKASSTS